MKIFYLLALVFTSSAFSLTGCESEKPGPGGQTDALTTTCLSSPIVGDWREAGSTSASRMHFHGDCTGDTNVCSIGFTFPYFTAMSGEATIHVISTASSRICESLGDKQCRYAFDDLDHVSFNCGGGDVRLERVQ